MLSIEDFIDHDLIVLLCLKKDFDLQSTNYSLD